MSLSLYFLGLVATLGLATLTWGVSILKRDVSIVDGVWALMLLAAATVYATGAEPHTGRTTLILTLVVVWALRLSGHIIHRNWGEPEERRYRDIRRKYEPNFALKSLGLIFWFQAGLAWIISMPLWAALTAPVEFKLFDALGIAFWTIGMTFESIGDWQLSHFKADPQNHGLVMDRGFWRYTRHPNYFGECLIWWGFFLFALSAGAWWAVAGPLLLTYLLLKFSGVTLMEQTIVERRPAYRAYIARTNAFIPGPRKQGIQASVPGSSRHG
jgi:steroid 5-alpha reductase family enzyme